MRLGLSLAMTGAILWMSGCDGGGASDAGPGATFDASGSDCAGCVDGTGACAAGDAMGACGAGGAMCVACDAGEMCVDGLCETPPSCGPDNCAGCCDGDRCVDGEAAGACGVGGLACQACAADESCALGLCEVPCESWCAGCCDAAGQCLSGEGDAACGVSGEACGACPSGESCSFGTCVTDACSSSCGGCCSGDTCLGGDSSTACGADGLSCVDCGPSRVCEMGGCVVSETSRWDVVIERGVVPERNRGGTPWDSFGGLPDPYVDVWAASSDTADPAATGRSSTDDNDTTPYWADVVLSDVAARQLRFLRLAVYDDDPTGDDLISVCRWRPSDAEFSDTSITLTCPRADATGSTPATVEATLNVRLRPH